MRRFAQTVLLFLLGGMLCKLAVTGTYLRYVSDGYAPLLATAGVALLVIAGVNLWRDLQSAGRSAAGTPTAGLQLDGLFGSDRERAARPAPEPDGPRRGSPPRESRSSGEYGIEHSDSTRTARRLPDVDHRSRALAAGHAAAAHEGLGAPSATVAAGGPEQSAMAAPTAAFETAAAFATVAPATETPSAGGGTRTPRAGTGGGWGLLAVALAVLVLAPPALGPFPAGRAGAVAVAAPPDAPPPGDPVAMSLGDYAAHAAAGAAALAGRQVKLVGFVMAGPRGEPYLARLIIGCCAAGAQPVKVGLAGDLPGVLAPGGWLEVVGTHIDREDLDPVNGVAIPYLSVVSVAQIPPPADPYES